MTNKNRKEWFSEIETIVTEPLKFKVKLAIGEDAYKSLRLKKAAWEVWDVAGVAGTGVWVAKLPWVASLLGSKGALVSLGLATATTPIGWVILAGILSGGAWLGITRYLKSIDGDRVVVIPKFINTPLDILALCLFDLIAPLALKIANVDGRIDPEERQAIRSYLIKEWGYDLRFIDEGIAYTESKLDDYKIKDLAQTLAEFQKQNPDCNYNIMTNEIVNFLRKVIEADGKIDEREEMAVEKVKIVFDDVGKINFIQMTKSGVEALSESVSVSSRAIKAKTVEVVEKTGDLTSVAYDELKVQGGKAAEFVSDACDSAMTHGKEVIEGLKSKVVKKSNA